MTCVVDNYNDSSISGISMMCSLTTSDCIKVLIVLLILVLTWKHIHVVETTKEMGNSLFIAGKGAKHNYFVIFVV